MYCSDYYVLIKKLFTGDLYANRGNIIGCWMKRANIANFSHCSAKEQNNRTFCAFQSVSEKNYTCKYVSHVFK